MEELDAPFVVDLQQLALDRVRLNRKRISLREKRIELSIRLEALTTLVPRLLTFIDERGHNHKSVSHFRDQFTQNWTDFSTAERDFSKVEQQVNDQEFVLASAEQCLYEKIYEKCHFAENSISTRSTSMSLKGDASENVEQSMFTAESPSLGSMDPYEHRFGFEVPYGRSPGQRRARMDNGNGSLSLTPLVPQSLEHLDPVYASPKRVSAKRSTSDTLDLDSLFVGDWDFVEMAEAEDMQRDRDGEKSDAEERNDKNSNLLLSHLLLNFRDPLDRLNRWLLHELRCSKAKVHLLAKYIQESLSTSQNPPPKDLSKAVLDWWLIDSMRLRQPSERPSENNDVQSLATTRDTVSTANCATRPSTNTAAAWRRQQLNRCSSSQLLHSETLQNEARVAGMQIKIFVNDFVPKSNPREFFVVGRVFEAEWSVLECALNKVSMPHPWPLLRKSVQAEAELDLKLVVIDQDPYLDHSICCPILTIDANLPIDTVLALRKFPKILVADEGQTHHYDDEERLSLSVDCPPEINVELSGSEREFEGDTRYLPSIRLEFRHDWPVRDIGSIAKKGVRTLLLLADIAKEAVDDALSEMIEQGDNETLSFHSSFDEHSISQVSEATSVTDNSTHRWLIPGYWKRTDGPGFFSLGRVFAMIWRVPGAICAHHNEPANQPMSFERLDIRRMVVRRPGERDCWCHPIVGCVGDDTQAQPHSSSQKEVVARPLAAEDNRGDVEDDITIDLATDMADANHVWGVDFGRMYRINYTRAQVMNIGVVAERCLPRFESNG